MHIGITGIAGFIGTNAAMYALADGHKVTGLDNFYTGRRSNLEAIEGEISFVEHDVRQPFPELKIDALMHLACPASPVHYQADPMFTWETAIFGTKNAVDLAESLNIPILVASTSEVYGDPNVSPQPESYWGNVNCIGERSCYDEGKRAAETYANDKRRLQGVDVRIVRIFNTYGPYMCADDGRVVSNFLVQTLREQPLTVYGEGSQTRSFCYVDDLVRGLFALLLHPDPVPLPVNLGNPDERTIKSLIEVISGVAGRELPIIHLPLPSDDPLQRRPDTTRASTLLNWQPNIALSDGIRKTMDYFRRDLASR